MDNPESSGAPGGSQQETVDMHTYLKPLSSLRLRCLTHAASKVPSVAGLFESLALLLEVGTCGKNQRAAVTCISYLTSGFKLVLWTLPKTEFTLCAQTYWGNVEFC